ncbi:MAG TPA: deoxyribose-phosphate aldolase [Anaerolineales bacterium]|jgi:deoxyribose-phosphate aldolase|nr:deoxyribose-phosphate aldolase [Anaerolineales bacterium]HQX15183.1 deoxyribose-phosphate aldolase [Anaerolineales bacterium]
MTKPDPKLVEQLVEIITHEVLAAMMEDETRASNPEAHHCKFDCADGLCVRMCFDEVGNVVKAGAERISSTLGVIPQGPELAGLIDHTLLKPDATQQEIAQLCYEARKYSFASVCVNPTWVSLCAELLKGSDVKVCTVIGFPLGATSSEAKAFETETAIKQGATEIDMVINVGALKARDIETVARDIRGVVKAAHARGIIVKVIIETVLLTDEEKTIASLTSKEAGADFVKTSTGFAGGGATAHDVELMRKAVGPHLGVKASGGVRTFEDAQNMIQAGATRIGASAGVKIIQGPSDQASPKSEAAAGSSKY